MKIAVTYEAGDIFQHFGHSKQLKFYEIKGKEIVNSEIIDIEGTGHGAICEILKENNVDTLICGGLGSGARALLEENNIKIYPGVIGNADISIRDFLNGNLNYHSEAKCNHHKEDKDCKNHNCREDKGGCTGNK